MPGIATIHHVTSHDGVKLTVAQAGNPHGLPVVFLHGTCSSHHIWKRQLEDDALGQSLRMLALDLRGHGDSDKPSKRASYAESQCWAGDLQSVFDYFELEKALVVAWSYGGRVINDYMVHFGTKRIAGVNYIAAGTLSTSAVKGPGYTILAQLFSDNVAIRQRAEQQFAEDLCAGDVETKMYEQILSDIHKTSLKTRLYMRDRVMSYEAMLASLSIPVLLSHGKRDNYSLPILAQLLNKHIPQSTVSWYENQRHLLFYTAWQRFNDELAEFTHKAFEACLVNNSTRS